MMDWLTDTLGMDAGFARGLQFVIALLAVLFLIALFVWLLRRFSGVRLTTPVRQRQPRLAVMDSAPVDSRRRLVLVRRDNVEHLVLIGGPSDIVVEQNIVRGVPVGTYPRTTAPVPGQSAAAPQPPVPAQPAGLPPRPRPPVPTAPVAPAQAAQPISAPQPAAAPIAAAAPLPAGAPHDGANGSGSMVENPVESARQKRLRAKQTRQAERQAKRAANKQPEGEAEFAAPAGGAKAKLAGLTNSLMPKRGKPAAPAETAAPAPTSQDPLIQAPVAAAQSPTIGVPDELAAQLDQVLATPTPAARQAQAQPALKPAAPPAPVAAAPVAPPPAAPELDLEAALSSAIRADLPSREAAAALSAQPIAANTKPKPAARPKTPTPAPTPAPAAASTPVSAPKKAQSAKQPKLLAAGLAATAQPAANPASQPVPAAPAQAPKPAPIPAPEPTNALEDEMTKLLDDLTGSPEK